MGLHKHQVGLRAGDRAVPDPSGDHQQLPWAEHDVVAVLQREAKLASQNEEPLVGRVVLVPHELALDLDQLEVVVVDAGHDLRAPVVVEACELLLQVHLANQLASSHETGWVAQPAYQTALAALHRPRSPAPAEGPGRNWPVRSSPA